MYSGSESLINDGVYLKPTVKDFWQWAIPDLSDATVRGTFAEFIVKSALDSHGYVYNETSTGWEPYDLDGPEIPTLNRKSRIEVKCSAFLQKNAIRQPDHCIFSIAPAQVIRSPEQGFVDGDPKQRNNDIYVFCVYTATQGRANILDLSWWEFYVLPTQQIENNPKLVMQKTISLKRVKELCSALTYDELCPEIIKVCEKTVSDQVRKFYPPPNGKNEGV
ncbi:MAG: hypothetical protein LUD12_10380 [Lachnospiraceae bacterium]|nr:hypothetical protein [Lachnospiraceae bacterium]